VGAPRLPDGGRSWGVRSWPTMTSVRPSSGSPVMTLPVRCQAGPAVSVLMTVTVPAPGAATDRRAGPGTCRPAPAGG